MFRIRSAALAATLPTAALLAGSLALALGAGSVPVAQPSPIAPTSAQFVAASSPSSVARATARAPFPKLGAARIKNLAIGQFKKASSVHLAGTFVDKKDKYSIDLRIGKDAEGTMTTKDGTFRIRRVGNTLYLQPAASDPSGAWVKVDRSDPNYSKVAPITTLSSWAKELGKLPVSVRKPGKVFGRTPTIGLYQPGRHGGTLWVATVGPAFLRYVRATDGSVRMALFDWNKPVSVETPADTSLQPGTV